jgi:hypothetical protein
MQPGISPDLHRLQDQDREAGLAQMTDHAALIAAGRLDPDTCGVFFGEGCGQPSPAGWCVLDLPAFRSAVNGDIELGFGRIDAGRFGGSLAHLRRPCLVKRTLCSGNHPGPMKDAGDDHATTQPKGG